MISQLLAIFLVCIVMTPTSIHAFSDINYNWYKESIQALHEKQIINGYDDGSFGAEKPISRAEILKILL
jgi:S-layer homology domain